MFRKFNLTIVLLLIMLFAFGWVVNACTAFKVENKNGYIYYAKNWDFNPARTDSVFYLSDVNENLSRMDIRLSNSGYLCSSYNSDGFFITTNYNSGHEDEFEKTSATIELRDIHEDSMSTVSTVDGLVESLTGIHMISPSYFDEHLFAADATGNACVVETDNINGYFTYSKDSYLVTTNFPNYSVKEGMTLGELPCDRFKAVYAYVSENSDNSFEDCIEALRRSVQNYERSCTQYSIIADPQKNVVYLFLNRDFNLIWEISLKNRTISTFKGFADQKSFDFDEDGISFIELWDFQKEDPGVTIDNSTPEDNRQFNPDIKVLNMVTVKNVMETKTIEKTYIPSEDPGKEPVDASDSRKSSNTYIYILAGIVVTAVVAFFIFKKTKSK